MTVNTLGQVKRFGDSLEEDEHNLISYHEQLFYWSWKVASLVISSSTTLGSGNLGMIARQFDYYELNPQEISMAVQQLQRFSTYGMPLNSVKFGTSKLDKSIDDDMRAILLNTYSPSISTLELYGLAKRYLTD
jgi:hypothetical protein